MKDPNQNPIDLGPSEFDRYEALRAKRNKEIECEDLATVSVIGLVLTLAAALILHWLHGI